MKQAVNSTAWIWQA